MRTTKALRDEFTDSATLDATIRQLDALRAMPTSGTANVCTRALLLLAMYHHNQRSSVDALLPTREGDYDNEDEVDQAFEDDLLDRVLPVVTPPFLRALAQAPVQYVVLSLVLTEMWRGEPLDASGLTDDDSEDGGFIALLHCVGGALHCVGGALLDDESEDELDEAH